MSSLVKSWLIEWFSKAVGLSSKEIEENFSSNYFEKGWIDSFQFISFISEVEEKFGIRFSNDEFQDRNFSNLSGLEKIIEEKIRAKK